MVAASDLVPDLLRDLEAETSVLLAMLVPLAEERWELSTPAAGWSVRDQVSHLAHFDQAAVQALARPEEFRRERDELMALGPDFPDLVAARHRALPPLDLLAWFVSARGGLLAAFTGVDGGTRLPWYGPDMGAGSALTARLMETWAHGQDVADALGVVRVPTERLRHVAHLGVATRGFSYRLRGREAPDVPVLVTLAGPDGATWVWGDPSASDVVSGTALDFCLVVTQRRHLAATDLRVTAGAAAEWMSLAQAYAGAPGPGRAG